MSLTRQFFREVAPLLRMLEQPFTSSVSISAARNWNFLDSRRGQLRPAIDVTDHGDKYVLDAELPGIGKECIDVRVGDGGRSITIEGKVRDKNLPGTAQPLEQDALDTTAIANGEQPTDVSVEREFKRNVSFTKTVWLPRSVETQDVSARLENGVLTILAKKAEDEATTTIPIQ